MTFDQFQCITMIVFMGYSLLAHYRIMLLKREISTLSGTVLDLRFTELWVNRRLLTTQEYFEMSQYVAQERAGVKTAPPEQRQS